MAELRIDPAELKDLIQEIATQVVDRLSQQQQLLKGKLAISEPEAAELLSLNTWQLRDLRLARKIGHSRIVGNKVRYTMHDLTAYLQNGHEAGTNGRYPDR